MTHTHDRQHDHAAHALPDGMNDLLELDAEVLRDYWTAALDWVRDAAAPLSPARLLDLGAGTGTGAIGLAQRFPEAEVVALDISPVSVDRVRAKAAALVDPIKRRILEVLRGDGDRWSSRILRLIQRFRKSVHEAR